jgi:hypothetical protein
MNIIYKDNPLTTEIELNEEEQSKLWYKVKIAKMEEKLFDASYYLEGENFNLEKAKFSVNQNFYFGENDDEESPLDKEANEMFINLSIELKSMHAGDCTCIPCSCFKCYAESLVGVDTLKGLSKYSAEKIMSGFGYGKDNKTIEEVINDMENDDCIPTEDLERWEKMGGYEQYIPRWKNELEEALKWLKTYKQEKLNR